VNHPLAPLTPISPGVLLQEIRELLSLLDDLAPILKFGLPPTFEMLRGDLELALERPESLGTAQNQLDLIEELAEAVWGDSPAALMIRTPTASAADPGLQNQRRPADLLERLDQLSEHLCLRAEAWHRRRTTTALSGLSTVRHSPG
jgi:hypothetical protein